MALRDLYRPEHVRLRTVEPADYRLLYDILVERYEQAMINIDGHATEKLPNYQEHVAYLERRPYKRHDIVLVDGVPVGRLFINHENVVGCFLLRAYVGRRIGPAASYTLFLQCDLPVIAYINPKNRPACRMAEWLGMDLIEELPHRVAYELRARPSDPFAPRECGGPDAM